MKYHTKNNLCIRRGKGAQLIQNVHPAFKTVVDTLFEVRTSTIFLSMETWLMPQQDFDKYNWLHPHLIRRLRLALRSAITPDSLFSTKMIITDVDTPESGIRKGKTSFVRFDITLNTKQPHKIKEVVGESHKVFEAVINDLLKMEAFEFRSKKIKMERA